MVWLDELGSAVCDKKILALFFQSLKKALINYATSIGDASLFQKYGSGGWCGRNRPNSNTGFVNIGKIPVCDNAKNISEMHVKTTFLVVVVNGESSIKSHPFASLKKFGHDCEWIFFNMMEHISKTFCEGQSSFGIKFYETTKELDLTAAH